MGYTTALGFTPIFRVDKGGEDITSAFADRMVSIKIESREGGGDADVVDMTIDDRGWEVASPSIGEGSTTLKVYLGYAETGLSDMGTFQIDELDYIGLPKAMVLHGNSLGFSTAVKAPLITAYDGQTLGDIVGAVATAAGVSPVIGSALSGIAIPYLNQHSSSMHLLQEMERNFNGLAKFEDGKLSFTERGTGEAASGASIGTFVLGPEDFGPNYDIKTTNRNAYSKVRVSWWDADEHQQRWLTSATGGNPNSEIPFMIKRIARSQQEAQSIADSTMSQLNRKSKQGTLTLAKGSPMIRGSQGFAIQGTREGIDGSYLIRCATHTYTKAGGIVTTLDFYDEGDGVDFSTEATDGQTDFTGTGIIPENETPVTAIPTAGGAGSA